MSRSNLVNGLAKEVPVADYTPWWKPAMIGLDVALGILTAGSCALFLLSWNKARKEEKA